MAVDLLTTYALIMKIIGFCTVLLAPISTYLIVCHSGKIGKEYKYALVIHHSLMFAANVSLNLCYTPVLVLPYVAVYPGGYLKEIVPGVALLTMQLSISMVATTSLGPLFHLRALAVLPPNHYLGRPYILYPLFGYYFITPIIMNPILVPLVCWGQENIKRVVFENLKIYNEMLFDELTIVVPMFGPWIIIWIGLMAFGSSTYIFASIVFIIMTYNSLNNMKTNFSQRTRTMQRKLTRSLIIQAMFYNFFFIGISSFGIICGFTGNVTTIAYIVVFWSYSLAFLLGSVLLIMLNESYKRALFDICCSFVGKRKVGESTFIVVTAR